jgi:hypothetical protein
VIEQIIARPVFSIPDHGSPAQDQIDETIELPPAH